MSKTQNFAMVSGDDKTLSVSCVDNNGDAVTVTGGSASYEIATSVHASTPSISKTSTAGEITLSGSTITITLEPDDTADLDGEYYHELQVTDASGNVYTGFSGTVIIRKDLI